MAIAFGDKPVQQEISGRQAAKPGFFYQLGVLSWRGLLIQFRLPEGFITTIVINIFFLLTFNGAFSGAASFLPGLNNVNYLAFSLPVTIVSLALGGIAGQAMVRDIESGYFDKLLLTPVNRSALLLSYMVAGALALVLQTVLIVLFGLLLGLTSVTGFVGLLVNAGYALLLGIGFAAFTVGVALRTGSAAATQSATFLFFPLTFLTTTYVPLELLSGWFKVAVQLNPITYVLEAMRSVLITGWKTDALLSGLAVGVGLGLLCFAFAFLSLRKRVSRK
jgi:ABC-2 type transport system permease protein